MWDHFLGSLNDQTILFWFAWWRENYSSFEGNSFNYSFLYGSPIGWVVKYFPNQWLIWGIYFYLAKLSSPIFAFNLLTLITAFLILVISFFYFRGYFSKSVSSVSAFLYLLSTYSIYKLTNHIDLFQIWVIPLFLIVFNKYTYTRTKFYLILSSLTLVLITFISNYYAFFLLLYIAVATCCSLFYSSNRPKIFNIIKDFFIFLCCYFIFVTPVMLPFLKISSSNTIADTGSRINRPIDDFVTFSARPWNYVLPSSQNPLLGTYVDTFNAWLSNKNYFLFNNYFAKEHGAIYLGIGNILLLLLGIILIYKNQIFEPVIFKRLLFICTILFIFSLPPFFTISGTKIFLPSYLIYKIIPVFRVLSRLFVIIYLLVLTLNGFTMEWLQTKLSKSIFWLFVIVFVFIHVSTSLVRINVTDLSSTPEIYTYLKNNTEPKVTIAVYPYSKTNEFLYWMKEHRRGFFNPRDYCNNEYCSEQVTKEMPSPAGIARLKEYGVTYILVSEAQNIADFEPLILAGDLSIISEIKDSYLLRVNP